MFEYIRESIRTDRHGGSVELDLVKQKFRNDNWNEHRIEDAIDTLYEEDAIYEAPEATDSIRVTNSRSEL